MKRAPRSLQHHVLYRKYNGQDSEISALLGKCGIVSFRQIFTASLDACEEIFGIEAFRLPASTTGYRKLSFALFDAVAVAVSRRIWLVPTLLTRKAAVQTGLDQLIHQRPDLFTGKSNTSISVRERISVVEGLFDSLS